jgi:hypothetical protein
MRDAEVSTRVATLVLVTPDGDLVGALPPFPVETPWWQDAEPVVRAARERFGIELVVLRILETERPYPGGAVSYLAEVTASVPAAQVVTGPVAAAQPRHGRLDDHPLRQSWARPGGPDADLSWARSELAVNGLRMVAAPQQVRTWNLSSLWRLPVEGETVWLKVVPPFFAHEGRILDRLRGEPVPSVIAAEGLRILLHEIPGEDLYGSSVPQRLTMVSQLVGIQRAWLGRVDELLALGAPDWRAALLASAIDSVVERTAADLRVAERAALVRFVEDLGSRLAAVAACGIPDTLVHGDFHDGNHRGDGTRIVLLDWGDSGVGHPLLDQPAFMERMPPDSTVAVRDHWNAAWRMAIPGSDPERAAELLAPVAAARQAVIYRHFLDRIEPSERAYHAGDPAAWLRRTAAALDGQPVHASGKKA